MKRITKLLSLALALLLALLPLTAWAEESEAAPIEVAPAETEIELASEFEDAPEVEVETEPEGMPAQGIDETFIVYESTEATRWVGWQFRIDYPEMASATFKSSSTKVATVDTYGVVTCKRTGTTKITVNLSDGQKRTLTLKVISKGSVQASLYSGSLGHVPVKSGATILLWEYKSYDLYAGDGYTSPESGFEVTTYDETVADASQYADGSATLYTYAPGTTTVTVKSSRGKKLTFKVRVVSEKTPTNLYRLEVHDPDTYDEYLANSLEPVVVYQHVPVMVEAITEPSDAEGTYDWKFSNSKIAKVVTSQDTQRFCIVEPLKEGTTTLTCTTDLGLKETIKLKVEAQKTCQIDMYHPMLYDTDEIAKGKTGTALVGEELEFSQVLNFGTEVGTCKWKSSNSKVLKITGTDNSGSVKYCTAQALKAGSATLTCTSSKLGKFSIKVKVLANKVDKVHPKPTKAEMQAAGFGVSVKSVERKADGSLVVELYLLNANGTVTWLETMDGRLIGRDSYGNERLHAFQGLDDVKLNSKKYASKTFKLTFRPDSRIQDDFFDVRKYADFEIYLDCIVRYKGDGHGA